MAKVRKTRQEKIIADLRRKLAIQQEFRVKIKEPKEEAIQVKTPQVFPEPSEKIFPSASSYNYSYVTADLRKTLFLTLGAFAFEFMFYWLFRKGGVQLFFR